MKCMEIDCFLGDDVLMVLWILNPLIASICVHFIAHLAPPFFASGLRACGIIDSIADFSGISMR